MRENLSDGEKTFFRNLGIAILVVFAVLILKWLPHPPDSADPPPAESAPSVRPGDSVSLYWKPGDRLEVALATTPEAFDHLIKLAVARDEFGERQMLARGELFIVQPGTRASVIDRGFASVEVRIRSGPHAGRSGWVPIEVAHP